MLWPQRTGSTKATQHKWKRQTRDASWWGFSSPQIQRTFQKLQRAKTQNLEMLAALWVLQAWKLQSCASVWASYGRCDEPPQTRGLKAAQVCSLTVWRPAVWNQSHRLESKVSGCAPSRDPREEHISLPCPFQLLELLSSHSLAQGPFLHLQSQQVASCFSGHVAFFLCKQISLCLPLIRTLVVTFKAPLDNPGQSPRLNILDHICKVPFVIKGNIQGFWDILDILGGHDSACHSFQVPRKSVFIQGFYTNY